jgi:hypothetical protein
MSQVFNRFIQFGVFQSPNQDIASTAETGAHLVRIMPMVNAQPFGGSTANRASALRIQAVNVGGGSFVPGSDQGYSTLFRAAVSAFAFLTPDQWPFRFGCAQRRSRFGTSFHRSNTFLGLGVPLFRALGRFSLHLQPST